MKRVLRRGRSLLRYITQPAGMELYDSPIPFLVQATWKNEFWWRRTTNTDVSNGVTRLSLAVLGDEQKERKDVTRQSRLYKIFESG